MHNSREGLPIGLEAANDQTGQEWGGMFPEITKLSPAQDYSSMYKDLPDGKCQAEHWGYVLSGTLKISYTDREEEIGTGEAFYLSPGHLPHVDEPTELVQFSPLKQFRETMEAMHHNAQPGKNL